MSHLAQLSHESTGPKSPMTLHVEPRLLESVSIVREPRPRRESARWQRFRLKIQDLGRN